ncbi:hypothetical protein GCM10010253_47590 [Streptomyces badius]|uniref:Uncharacterized protein n=1 Tax=Streptomyces badius TaxID=1941 RepID=A0ABQ2TGP9_STRBA|nr:hypothetical protein GCM10010253_47590 [Streptomyces badius]
MPPVSLTQRAYVCAIAGTPAIFTALMSSDRSGAQVITVTGSLEPPVAPGSTPQPDSRSAPAAAALMTPGKGRGKVGRRRPVMEKDPSGPGVTARCAVLNAR